MFIAGETSSVGSGRQDVLVQEWSPAGALRRTVTWGGTGEDRAYGIAAAADRIYVAGWWTPPDHNWTNLLVLAVDRSLATVWAYAPSFPNTTEFTRSVAVTTEGVYAAGERTCMPRCSGDALLVKLSTAGAPEWTRQWGGPGEDRAWSVSAWDGGIYVTGSVSVDGDDQMFLRRYSSDGTLAWERLWGGAGIDSGWRVHATALGVLVTGYTDSYGNGYADAFIHLYDFDGNPKWQRTWGGVAWDAAYAAWVEGENIYVAGGTHSYGNGKGDAMLLRFEADGSLYWFRVWGGRREDSGLGLSASGKEIYLTGYVGSYGNGGNDLYVVKYTDPGDVVPPLVLSTSPEDGAGNVSVGSEMSVTFSEAMEPRSVEAAFSTVPPTGGSFTWTGNSLRFAPSSPLLHSTNYTVRVAANATDLAGNAMTQTYSSGFATEPAPPRVPDPARFADPETALSAFVAVAAAILIAFAAIALHHPRASKR